MAIETNQQPFSPTEIEAIPLPGWQRRALTIQWAIVPLLLLDALCIVLSLAGAHYLRFGLMPYYGPYSGAFYTRLTWITLPTWLIIFALYQLYNPDRLFGGLREYTNAINACTFGLVALIVYSFLDRNVAYDLSRGWLAMLWALSTGSVIAARFSYRRLIYHLRKQGLFARKALIVGINQEARTVALQLRNASSAGLEIVGFVDPTEPRTRQIDGLPVLDGRHNLNTLIHDLGIEELIVIPTALRREALLDIYRDWGTNGKVRLSLSSGLYELFTTGAEIRELGFVPLVNLKRTRITGIDALAKEVFDRTGALVGLIILSPVLLIIALLVRLTSAGPIIHRRRVVGLHGREFDAYKFRTMIPNADTYLETHPALKQEWEQTGKIQDDPRITRIGRILRRYSLDELPQLLNVLKGEMSLVGPRMITPAELKHFGRWQHNLMTVKPGLTGLWQVNGRSDLAYDERVQLDMRYIRNYTIWLDLKVLFDTFRVVLKGQGAY